MNEMAYYILDFALAIYVVSWFWFLYIVWQVDKRWFFVGVLLAGLPLPVFAVWHWQLAKRPFFLSVMSLLIAFMGLVYAGDLWHDKHTEESSTRTFSQRLFGCSGFALWERALNNTNIPIENLMPQQLPVLSSDNDELSNARAAAFYAALAYSPEKTLESQIQNWGLPANALHIFELDDTHYAFLLISDEWQLIAFRGTNDKKDWPVNLKFIPAETQWGLVHKGFHEAVDSLWPKIIEVIAHSGNDRPIWLTGHSLGGAMAQLAGARLLQNGMKPAGVITFGQPPVGYQTFANRYDLELGDDFLRFVDNVDIVPKVFTPLTYLQLSHAGRLYYFDTAGELHVGGPDRLQLYRDSVCAPEITPLVEVAAHDMRMYLIQLGDI